MWGLPEEREPGIVEENVKRGLQIEVALLIEERQSRHNNSQLNFKSQVNRGSIQYSRRKDAAGTEREDLDPGHRSGIHEHVRTKVRLERLIKGRGARPAVSRMSFGNSTCNSV